jgi:anti-sigma factor RsiW
MSSPCRTIRRCVESYLDGELEPSLVLEVEQHSEECATCRERIVLDRAIRAGVRRNVVGAKASDGFRDRVRASMSAEREQGERAAQLPSASARTQWLLAAAAVAAVFYMQHRNSRESEQAGSTPQAPASSHASVGLDAMLDQFADWHARPLLPETTNANDLPRFEPYVGVPVRAPALSPFGARFLGGRILPTTDERVTAMLQYTVAEGHRISIYVYDPRRISTHPSRLRPRTIDSEPVYVGNVHGYSIAAAEKRGVGYAIASDLNDDESAELVLAAAPR